MNTLSASSKEKNPSRVGQAVIGQPWKRLAASSILVVLGLTALTAFADSNESTLSKDITVDRESMTEIEFASTTLESTEKSSYRNAKTLQEEDLGASSFPLNAEWMSKNQQFISKNPLAGAYSTAELEKSKESFTEPYSVFTQEDFFSESSENVPVEKLYLSQKRFRTLFSKELTRPELDGRYLGSLLEQKSSSVFAKPFVPFNEGALASSTHENLDRLAPEKVYTVVDGNIVEVNPFHIKSAPQTPRHIKGDNWTVRLAEVATAEQKVEKNKAQVQGALASEGGAGSNSQNLPRSASQRTGKSLTKPWLERPTDGSTSEGQDFSAQTTTIRGKVVVPNGVDARTVYLRIAGTPFQIPADADGTFEFQEIPVGSKMELLIWDTGGSLSRRLVPVAASDLNIEKIIELEIASFADEVSASFGVRQNLTESGFCARIGLANPLLALGAQVEIEGSEEHEGPYFFNNNNLPEQGLTEVTEDSRFCVFNVKSELLSATVQLVNGTRRSFTVHLKPSVFESLLDFDMESAIYRPVAPLELVDSSEAMAAHNRNDLLDMGNIAAKKWVAGTEGASWTPVSHVALGTDRAYASVPLENDPLEGAVYFPTGEDFVEVNWSSDGVSNGEGFRLISREELVTEKIAQKIDKLGTMKGIFQDRTKPLDLKLLGVGGPMELQALLAGESISSEQGAAFVSLNLAKLNLEYSDVRISLRDSWSGERVGDFSFVPPAEGTKNPRFVRGFFTNIPPGQYTLMVTDKSGAVKWLDIVRSRSGSFQILTAHD